MMWIAYHRNYYETVAILRRSQTENLKHIDDITSFFASLKTKFGTLFEARRPTVDPPRKSKSDFALTRRTEDRFDGVRSAHLYAYRSAHRDLQDRILPFLVRYRTDYNDKMTDAIDRMTVALDCLLQANTRFESAYRKYKRAAADLVEAHDEGLSNLRELKTSFEESQRQAVDAHSQLNETTAQTAVLMEAALTQYEGVEMWRAEQLRQFLVDVADCFENLAGLIEESNAAVVQLETFLPDLTAVEQAVDVSKLQVPEADDRFQFIPIDPRATQFLDRAKMFAEEQKDGGKLFRVVRDCTGHGEYLSAIGGEIVCCLKEAADYILAVNINQSEGLLKKEDVEKVTSQPDARSLQP
jgi:uncharacterized protein YukE